MTFAPTDDLHIPTLTSMATALRFLAIDMVEKAGSGHPGMPMGMADVVTLLYAKHFRFFPGCPTWPNRDRFVLSAGHGSALLYALLHLTGYQGFPLNTLKSFRQLGSKAAGHPECDPSSGIETTTGPLAQGFANAVGMALAKELLAQRFGSHVYTYRTYCIVGDGCLMEGLSQEALTFAGHHQLKDLIVLFDDNGISIDGPTSLSTSEDTLQRFQANNWCVERIDGHDFNAIDQALCRAKESQKPSLIACRTTIGKGAPTVQGTAKVHGTPLGFEESQKARELMNWPHAPFHVPPSVKKMWRNQALKQEQMATQWMERHAKDQPALERDVIHQGVRQALSQFQKTPKSQATRQSSHDVLQEIEKVIEQGGLGKTSALIGGSADLTPSNLTQANGISAITPGNKEGRYLHYGIREHAMAGIMNGLCLSGFRPFGGTFLVFSDYLKPALRLSAMMNLPVVYVFTHDSIGVGEDGPTHQPVEHLASLRAIPGLSVYRPADAQEVAVCWQLALEDIQHPSALALSRQATPLLDEISFDAQACARGGHVVYGQATESHVAFLATGTEVALAIAVAKLLEEKGLKAHVVSLPCIERFLIQDREYQEQCIPQSPMRVAMEAGVAMGWHRFLRQGDLFFGVEDFGVSAPGAHVYDHFGLVAPTLAEKIQRRREKNRFVKEHLG